ncbi:unnamed protein product [Toxocara canis]|uniref:Splicing factor U2AF 26 kDa subunit n=1 Tax=Toxocara canis TaxID=6265 RepID=A0A183V7T0_TOXCA|nr:unnamed protein product [Toxocara canis]
MAISLLTDHLQRVNCSFYFKIGACRHGDKCSRLHVRPTYSQTILLKNFYRGAALSSPEISKEEAQRQFDEFYREVYTEIDDEYGRIEEMNVCDNVGEHMLGNVYIKFRHESSAERAVDSLNERWFDGRPIHCELSPVLDFRDACCRQYEIGECNRGGFCNFMHLKKVSSDLKRKLIRRGERQRKRKLVKTKRIEQKAKKCDDDDDDDDEIIPKKYQGSTSSDESSWSEPDVVPATEDRSSTPLAFRADRYPSDVSESESEPDPEIEAHKQMMRRQRWEELRDKLHIHQSWDEDREQNFVFSLL